MSNTVTPETVYEWRADIEGPLVKKERLTIAALLGSVVGNIVVGAAYAALDLGTSTLNVLRNVTLYTWPVFFDEVMTAADFVYALFSAGIAAFYANRRLTRRQYHAIRLWQEQNQRE